MPGKTAFDNATDAFREETREHLRWEEICRNHLPFEEEDSIWRYSRLHTTEEPSQGWKIHISATVLNACTVFETIVPLLLSQKIQFKAPRSLAELSKLNCGLQYGYSQVGKFITIYPASDWQAVLLAEKIHKLTAHFNSPAVPFDNQFTSGSCVYYRYGAFRKIKGTESESPSISYIYNLDGKLVHDDRQQPVPDWLSDPFKKNNLTVKDALKIRETPLNTDYQVLQALTQRGKGGVYLALDLSQTFPRLCIIKEGRRHGEADWQGFDGYKLIENETRILTKLGEFYKAVPEVFSSFEIDGNYYLVIEYIEGKSLYDMMKVRKRRFSIKQILKLSLLIAKIIESIHLHGYIWGDCKPANLILSGSDLRPIDFEGARVAGQSNYFGWKTPEFSFEYNRHDKRNSENQKTDLYALGAVIYFLLTGKFYNASDFELIPKLRRGVSDELIAAVQALTSLDEKDRTTISQIITRIEELLRSPSY